MLISHKHRFIFIHIFKNAGTSITHALMPFATNSWQSRANRWLKPIGITRFDPQPLPPHIRGPELAELMGGRNFSAYFSFAIVRNPWDWLVSLYTFIQKTPAHRHHQLVQGMSGFDEFIEWRCTREIKLQKDFIFTADGRQIVNFVGRYENLEEDFAKICARIGIRAMLPRLNASRTKPYQEYYDQKAIELVRRAYGPDIDLFGYHWS